MNYQSVVIITVRKLEHILQLMRLGGTNIILSFFTGRFSNIILTLGLLIVNTVSTAGCGSMQIDSEATPEIATSNITLPAATAQPDYTASPTPFTTPTPRHPETLTPSATLTSVPPTATKPTSTSTVRPSPAATPTPTPDILAGVNIHTTTLTLLTYPYRDYLIEETDPVFNIPVFYFNRPVFETDAPEPAPVEYTGVVLENRYLRLTFLPELGGRLYSAVVKNTGQELFYHNPVVKPSRYGVLQPYQANWWLATGGMEWAYPTQEHGYRFGVPWQYTVTQTEEEAIIQLSDKDENRLGVTVKVTLPANSAAFWVEPEASNNAAKAVPLQLWTNAALTLGQETMTPDTEFIVPTGVITIHSRGEAGWTIPGEKMQAPWPRVDETDLSDYQQWANYLGFFVSNNDAPFIGAYSNATRLGVLRSVGSEATTGAGKIFAFGDEFADRSYTDDNSQYFEIWGGANAGFWPEYDLMLDPGQTVGWREQWWPVAGLPALTWASETVAVAITRTDNNAAVSIMVARPITGTVRITSGKTVLVNEMINAAPASPIHWTFTTDGPMTIELQDANGHLLLSYNN
jgi:hypothetical protein